MAGELRDASVVIREQPEANRIYNKGGYGRPLSGGGLELDPVEAAFLVHQGRLEVTDGSHVLSRAELAVAATRRHPEFEVRFLAYRELREGRVVHPAPPKLREAGIDFVLPPKDAPKRIELYVRAVSERAAVAIRDLAALADRCKADAVRGLVAVVDEESDITQYDVAWDDPKGDVAPETRIDVDADLVVDRIVVWDEGAARKLHDREFFGRLVANQLHLSLVEGLHLATTRGVRIREAGAAKPLDGPRLLRALKRIEGSIEDRSRVYEDLKKRKLVPKTGYKFGTHFRAYERDPQETHAPFLVHVVDEKDVLEWPALSRAVRLAHGVRKTLLLAFPGPAGIRYLRVRRAA